MRKSFSIVLINNEMTFLLRFIRCCEDVVLGEELTNFLFGNYGTFILLELVILRYLKVHWWASVIWVCANVIWCYLSLKKCRLVSLSPNQNWCKLSYLQRLWNHFCLLSNTALVLSVLSLNKQMLNGKYSLLNINFLERNHYRQ